MELLLGCLARVPLGGVGLARSAGRVCRGGQEWVRSRSLCGADEWAQFLHSWSESAHSWVESKMSTAEATGWLRELLEPHVGVARASTLTVHGAEGHSLELGC